MRFNGMKYVHLLNILLQKYYEKRNVRYILEAVIKYLEKLGIPYNKLPFPPD